MKKILSIAIMAIFLLQNLAFAQVNNTSDIINCSKNPEETFCKSINITKDKIPLKSILEQDYSGYLVTIENNGDNAIELTKMYNDAPTALKKIKANRKKERFPKVLAEPVLGIVLIPIWVPISTAWSMSMKQYSMSMPEAFFETIGEYFSKEALAESGNLFFVQPAKGTILVPYYLIKDSIDDKKAAKELSQYKVEIQNVTINPKDKVKGTVLSGKYSLCKLGVLITDTKTGKQYRIEK